MQSSDQLKIHISKDLWLTFFCLIHLFNLTFNGDIKYLQILWIKNWDSGFQHFQAKWEIFKKKNH